MAAASAAGEASGAATKGHDGKRSMIEPRSMRTGRYLASLMTVAESVDDHSTTGDAGAAAAMERRVKDAAMIEMNHEIIGLGDKLVINEENLAELRASVDPDAAALVVSFLGDTSAGKSHTIRELMSVSESRPYCQEARGQSVATTFNVNLFPCQTIAPGMVVHLVDYEGENGSNTPIMMAARHLALREDTKVSRSQTVANFFPRLAYTTSDVIVMVSREPFYNRRYLDRCILLAKRANSGIANVQRPALILVGNKLPGDEVVLDVDASTTAFFDCWGDDAQELDSFFSAILCVYIPHKNSIWTDPKDPSRRLDGAVACKQQLDKLRNILAVLGRRRAAGKPIDPGVEEAAAGGGVDSGASSTTSSSSWSSGTQALSQRHGVWFGLLPRVVDELNAGRGVDVGRLLDEAWQEASRARASEDEGMFDAFLAFTASLRPPRALSATSSDYTTDVLERYSQFRRLAVQVSCRLLACRLRAIDRGLLVPDKVQAVVEETVAAVVSYLDSVAPCTAAYDPSGDKGTAALDRPDQVVHCLQEARAHSTHRTCVRVRGGKGIWGTIAFFVPFNDTWAGRHRPPRTEAVDVEACVEMVTSLAKRSDVSFLEALVELREVVSGSDSLIRIGLAKLGLPTSPHDGSPVDISHQLLPPCDPLGDVAFKALSIIPGVDAPASMPYCVGCGVKLTAATAGASETKSPGGTASSAGGLLGALASMFGLSQTSPTISQEAGVATAAVSAAGIMLEATAEAGERPGGSFRHDTSVSASAATTPSADLQALLEAVTGDEPSPGSISLPTSDNGGTGDGSETDSRGPPKHNVWLGLCPRCWSAAYTEPASRQAGEVFVPLPSGQDSVFD